jgi:ABC-type Fe3+-siderophore transport system permease subunit
MAAMPSHDPVPPKAEASSLAWARYKSMMKWMALASAIAAALAVAWLKATSETMPWQMVLATIAGVGLSVLLGTALMGLVFLSDRSGHDEGASGRESKP